ncbi:hypothetical protein O0L34_g19467 [Tuta absoluta]|nr:hypothetical protein O0L34_g19467 [Tuta absoluta]
MPDFQRLVGPDVLSALQNEVPSENDQFHKALHNFYSYLKDETMSQPVDIIPHDQRCILVEDEWMPIDYIPFIIAPSPEENVEEPSDVITKTIEETNNTEKENTKEINGRDNIPLVIAPSPEEDLEEPWDLITKSSEETNNTEKENAKEINRRDNIPLVKAPSPEEDLEEPSDVIWKSTAETNNTEKENMKEIYRRDDFYLVIPTRPEEDVEEPSNVIYRKKNIKEVHVNTKEVEIQENIKKYTQIIQPDKIDNTITSSAKIEDFLPKAPTPKRKGKILAQHSSIYVLTSEEWLLAEKEKEEKKEKAFVEKLEQKQKREQA